MSAPATVQEGLSQVQSAQLLLDRAVTFADVREVRAKASAAATYFRTHDSALGGVVDASALKLRAERKLGELLRDEQKNAGGRPSKKTGKLKLLVTPPTLKARGISKMDASRWQRLAEVPCSLFDSYLDKCSKRRRPPTCAGALGLVIEVKPNVSAPVAAAPHADKALFTDGNERESVKAAVETLLNFMDVIAEQWPHDGREFMNAVALWQAQYGKANWKDWADDRLEKHYSDRLASSLDHLRIQRESDPNYEAARATEKQIRERLGSTKSSLMIDFVLRGGELAMVRLGLGLTYAGTLESVKELYKAQSLRAHPDKGGSQEEMARLNADYDLVKKYFEARGQS